MDIFFTGVGLTASWKLIKQGGRVCIGIAIATIGLILFQDVLGVALAMVLGCTPSRVWPGLPVPDGRRGHLQRHRSHL